MKKILLYLTVWLSLSTISHAQQQDSIQYRNVWICVTSNAPLFPPSWYQNPVNAEFEYLDSVEVKRSYSVCKRALDKYDAKTLTALQHIYILKSIRFFGQNFGGTYFASTGAVYLSNKGIMKNYTDDYIERVFHAEFSSILFSKYAASFDQEAWKKLNPPDFRYGNGGVDALKTGKSSEHFSDTLSQMGFLTEYGTSSLENDLNSYAKQLFLPKKGTKKMLEIYPALRRKWDFVIAFYHSISAELDAAHFEPFFPEE